MHKLTAAVTAFFILAIGWSAVSAQQAPVATPTDLMESPQGVLSWTQPEPVDEVRGWNIYKDDNYTDTVIGTAEWTLPSPSAGAYYVVAFNFKPGVPDFSAKSEVLTLDSPGQPPTPPTEPIGMSPSGPVNVSEDGAVVENLIITSTPDDDCAITINGKNDVTLRNLDIRHANVGICAQNASGLEIEGVKLLSNSAPERGPSCQHGVANCTSNKGQQVDPNERLAIALERAPDTRIEEVETTRASGGVYAARSPGTNIETIVCNDMRGPYPRGQCVQFNESNDSTLTNFYAKNVKDVSFSEDNVNAYKSDRVVVQDGLIDGNYSINGAGVIADTGSDNMIVRNVDAIHTALAAVSVWSNEADSVGENFFAENIRVKDTSCESRNGGKPSSDGLVIAAHPRAKDFEYRNVQYYNHCRSFTFYCRADSPCSQGSTGTVDIREEDFIPRDPLQVLFDWEASE